MSAASRWAPPAALLVRSAPLRFAPARWAPPRGRSCRLQPWRSTLFANGALQLAATDTVVVVVAGAAVVSGAELRGAVGVGDASGPPEVGRGAGGVDRLGELGIVDAGCGGPAVG